MFDRIQARYRKLVFLTWFLTLDLIMFGAFVRLTDSGLGCPDWPGCYGKVTPIGASGHIEQALQAMPHGAVSFSKAWIEMIHRYAGSILGMMIIGIVYLAWRYRKPLGNTPRLAIYTLIAVGAVERQAVVGRQGSERDHRPGALGDDVAQQAIRAGPGLGPCQ